jgi:uncharacterized protein (DUF2236 family)
MGLQRSRDTAETGSPECAIVAIMASRSSRRLFPVPSPIRLTKQAIIGRVRALFNDHARGEKPVMRSQQSLFGPGSVIWGVHGDVITMMVGGIAALLLQMLHPAVLAGVWDHSDFRENMLGRLRRTARFISITTFGSADEAEAAVARVRSVHGQVNGALADGTLYSATDPKLLAWVHVTEALCFLDAAIRYGAAKPNASDQDRYFGEMARIARMLGADPVPTTRAEAEQLLEAMRTELVVDERTREVADIVMRQRPDNPLEASIQAMISEAAGDLLPVWAREMHDLRSSVVRQPLVRIGTLSAARTLRWAFR